MIVAEVRRRFIAAEFHKTNFVATRFIALDEWEKQEARKYREGTGRTGGGYRSEEKRRRGNTEKEQEEEQGECRSEETRKRGNTEKEQEDEQEGALRNRCGLCAGS